MGTFRPSRGLWLFRLIATGAILGAFVAGLLFALPWINVLGTGSIRREITIAFLTGLSFAYASVVIALVAGAMICGLLFWRARHLGSNAHTTVRVLLLCIASLLAIGLAEILVGALRAPGQRGEPRAEFDASLPTTFAVGRETGVRVAVLGESSAFGMPFENRLSVGKIVAWQLEEAIKGQKFEVEMLAEPGATLEGQYRKLCGLASIPDALIVYCGHNEFCAEIPWSRKADHYLDERRTSRGWRDDLAAGDVTPVCKLIGETADRFRVGLVPQRGLRAPLVDAPAYTPDEYANRLADFRRRLEAIAQWCERIGTLAILVVPPSNDAGFEPNRSFLAAHARRADREAFGRAFLTVRSLEEAEPARAGVQYRTLLATHTEFAETHYRLACLLEREGKWNEAYEHFVKARDLDGLPMRCMTPFQNAYREVAARHGCVVLVDGQAIFHAIGPHGLLDEHLFMDAMHPSLAGQVALRRGLLMQFVLVELSDGRRGSGRQESTLPRVRVTSGWRRMIGS